MNELTESYDVIVVGAGAGGLNCGALLAKAGQRVAVIDKHSKLGGYGQHFGNPLTFDSDTHFLGGFGPGGWLAETLAELGLRERLEFIRLEPMYRCLFPGLDLCVPSDLRAYEALLAERFPAEADGIRRLFAEWQAMGEGYAGLMERGQGPLARYRELTVAEMLDGCVRAPELRAVLCALWPFAGLPPRQLSAIYFASLWHSFHHGGAHVARGGMKHFNQAIADFIEEHDGCQVALRTPVQRVLVDEGAATGVELEDGSVLRARAVVVNVNPADLFGRLIAPEAIAGVRYPPLHEMRPSGSAIQIHLGVEGPLSLPAQSTILHTTFDLEEAYRDALSPEPEIRSAVVSVPTLSDPERADGGTQMVVLMRVAPYEHPDGWGAPPEMRRDKAYRQLPAYLAAKDAVADPLIARAEAVIPDLSARVVLRKVATPITMERYTFNTQGAAYGWANTPEQSGARRPGATTPIRGLTLAGHWVFPGGTVAGVVLSARRAARAVLDRLGK